MTPDEELEARLQEIEKDVLFDLIKNSDDHNLAEAMSEPLLIAKLLYSEELAKTVQEEILKMDRRKLMVELERIKLEMHIQRIFNEEKELRKEDDGCEGQAV